MKECSESALEIPTITASFFSFLFWVQFKIVPTCSVHIYSPPRLSEFSPVLPLNISSGKQSDWQGPFLILSMRSSEHFTFYAIPRWPFVVDGMLKSKNKSSFRPLSSRRVMVSWLRSVLTGSVSSSSTLMSEPGPKKHLHTCVYSFFSSSLQFSSRWLKCPRKANVHPIFSSVVLETVLMTVWLILFQGRSVTKDHDH